MEYLQAQSLRSALREEKLWDLQKTLARIVPDIRRQCSSFEIDSHFRHLKARGMHAFQMDLAQGAIKSLCSHDEPLTIVDIGDSAGTHIQYLLELNRERKLVCCSINVDKEAVKRIHDKGLDAMQVRAEELVEHGINADIFLSFEMLEHLENPVQFLKTLAARSTCRAMVITVPYLSRSRVGLYHIRGGVVEPRTPENTHVFELCPADWRLLLMHAGWKVYEERLYLQYPRRRPLRVMKSLWKTFDFEGFWGAVLVRDRTWSDLFLEAE